MTTILDSLEKIIDYGHAISGYYIDGLSKDDDKKIKPHSSSLRVTAFNFSVHYDFSIFSRGVEVTIHIFDVPVSQVISYGAKRMSSDTRTLYTASLGNGVTLYSKDVK